MQTLENIFGVCCIYVIELYFQYSIHSLFHLFLSDLYACIQRFWTRVFRYNFNWISHRILLNRVKRLISFWYNVKNEVLLISSSLQSIKHYLKYIIRGYFCLFTCNEVSDSCCFSSFIRDVYFSWLFDQVLLLS